MEKKICLNGTWDFAPGPLNEGKQEDWKKGAIKVPSPFNVNGFAAPYETATCGETSVIRGADMRLYPQYPVEWDDLKEGSYHRHFFVPSDKKRVFLRFDAVAFESEYYINGVCVKQEWEAFLPIEFEITEHVRFGEENELVVYCRDASRFSYEDARGQTRFEVPRGSFWGMYALGIWQDTWLIFRDEVFISDVFAVPDTDLHTLTVSVETDGGSSADEVRLSLKAWNVEEPYRTIAQERCGAIVQEPCGAIDEPCSQKIVWQYDPDSIRLWDIGAPNLYMLRTELVRDGAVLDCRETRIGFRSFRAEGKYFLLNGRKVNLRCDSWHYMGYSVQDMAYAKALFEMEKQANVNIVRLHAQPYPEFFVDAADEAGILINDETAAWASYGGFGYTNKTGERNLAHAVRLMKRDKNHPSVVFWSLENESIMAYKAGCNPSAKDIADLEDRLWENMQACREYDDSRLFSGDGSWDLRGRAPVCSLHYPTEEQPFESNVPMTIGEMGAMYYATPDTVTAEAGEAPLLSMDGRLEAIAESARDMLAHQRKWAAQVCVFNLMWYGLEPMSYTARELPEGEEGQPGIQLQRITPYLRPINAGLDPALPEYQPNPVWNIIKDAYEPVRFFMMEPPFAAYSGTDVPFSLRVFNDSDRTSDFTLYIAWTGGERKTAFTLEAAGCLDTQIVIPAEKAGEMLLHITLEKEGQIAYSQFFTLTVYDKQEMLDKIVALNVPLVTQGEDVQGTCIDLRRTTLASLRHGRQQYSVYMPEKIHLNEKTVFDSFVPPLPVNGKPILFTGDGEPVAIRMEDRIVCGLPLWDDTQPQMLALRLRFSEMLKENVKQKAAEVDVYGQDRAFTTLLKELGVTYHQLSEKQLAERLRTKQGNVLVTTGEVPAQISRLNYQNVIVLNPEKPPVTLSGSFHKLEMKSFHLIRKNRDLGLYSNNLYGLTTGRVNVLADGLLELENDELENLLGQPDLDWRLWNHVAESVKTISVLRGQLDNSRRSALAEGWQAGSRLWFTTLSTENTPQLRHIWSRLLDELGVVLCPQKEGIQTLFTGSVYGDGTRKLLYYAGMKVKDAQPGLNKWQDGGWWRIVRQGKKPAGCYALYLYSPQDRRDFLLNPDTLDLLIEADQPVTCVLNGVNLGTDTVLPSVPLNAGWNLLLLETASEGNVPVVRVRRTNGMENDVICSLMDGVEPVDMTGTVYTAFDCCEDAPFAAPGTGRFWTIGKFVTQTPGMWFQIDLPKAERIRAICFGSRGEECQQDTNFPGRLDIYAGEDSEHLTRIAEGAPGVAMVYGDGAEQLKCFLSFPEQEVKCIRLQIAAVLLDRGFSIQDLQLFR
ncbi:MAG: hypothetical protein IJ390_01485 [Lachnospiraceae bacterium]|nr:hypothetical protein [Lachnospiraceae bacterium]